MSKCEFDKCEGHLGKFDSCQDEALYGAAMDADWIGDVEWDISAAYIELPTDESIKFESWDDRRITVPAGFYRVATDGRGFVYVHKFDSEEEWSANRSEVEADHADWADDGEEPPVLATVENGDTDEGDVWVRAFGFHVHVLRTDEGIVVDVWPNKDGMADAPLASTYAFDQE